MSNPINQVNSLISAMQANHAYSSDILNIIKNIKTDNKIKDEECSLNSAQLLNLHRQNLSKQIDEYHDQASQSNSYDEICLLMTKAYDIYHYGKSTEFNRDKHKKAQIHCLPFQLQQIKNKYIKSPNHSFLVNDLFKFSDLVQRLSSVDDIIYKAAEDSEWEMEVNYQSSGFKEVGINNQDLIDLLQDVLIAELRGLTNNFFEFMEVNKDRLHEETFKFVRTNIAERVKKFLQTKNISLDVLSLSSSKVNMLMNAIQNPVYP